MPFAVGTRVEIVGTLSGHNMPLGSQLTVRAYNGQFVQMNETHLNFYEADLKELAVTKEVVQRRMEIARDEADILAMKLAYLDETGLDRIDEKEFKSYQVLKLVGDGDLSLAEKAVQIAKLL